VPCCQLTVIATTVIVIIVNIAIIIIIIIASIHNPSCALIVLRHRSHRTAMRI